MDFLWPGFFALLGIIPILIGVYIWMLRRRRVAVRYSSLTLVREALPKQSWLRRHLPFILLMVGLASLIVAVTRPITVTAVPSDQTTVILAMDVSRSMCSTDIPPNRLEAAKTAAEAFVQQQESKTQIGIVAFSGFAELIQIPTRDQEVLLTAIDGLVTGRRTAIGSAILRSLDAISEIDKNVAPSSDRQPGITVAPVPDGAYVPDIIILLTDGANNAGPEPVDAAMEAAVRGVRVYTIGFGTPEGGEFPRCSSNYMGNEPFFGGNQFGGGFGGGGGFGPPGGFRRGIDEETLKQVAAITGGSYHSAESAGELHEVFQNLPTYLIFKHEVSEISVIFTAAGAFLASLAILLGLVWRPLP
jgi:Ca-activated chloride channel family protein